MFSIVRAYVYIYIRMYIDDCILARKSIQTSARKNLKFSVLEGNALKALKQAAEMKHELSACILAVGMHSVCVSPQLLVSVLFIAFPTNTEHFNFFLVLVSRVHNIYKGESI